MKIQLNGYLECGGKRYRRGVRVTRLVGENGSMGYACRIYGTSGLLQYIAGNRQFALATCRQYGIDPETLMAANGKFPVEVIA